MRPDRFAQSPGGEFVESRGKERDHPFSDSSASAQITAYCVIFGFIPWGPVLAQVTDEILFYPAIRVHEVYFNGSTHDVLIESTGDVITTGDQYANLTFTELAGAYLPGAVGPIVVTAQTPLVQTREIGNIPGSPFCTATCTIEGDGIPIQDYLHELYRLHALEGDFAIASLQMVRDPVTHQLELITPGIANDTLGGRIALRRGSGEIYGPSNVAPPTLACGITAAAITLFVSKTLMDIAPTGFSDWITQRNFWGDRPTTFSSLRCVHSVGVEVLQPPPIEMADDWFGAPTLGKAADSQSNLDLFHWAAPIIVGGSLGNAFTGTLPVCTA